MRSRQRRHNPSAQASQLAIVDSNTALAFAGGLILGAKNLPGWLTLLILGAAEVCTQIACKHFPDLAPDLTANNTEKAVVDAGAGMIGWWIMSKKS